MSYLDYKTGQHVECMFTSDEFYGIIQGAMRLADSDNIAKLKSMFPTQWKELQSRYNAAGGRLPEDGS